MVPALLRRRELSSASSQEQGAWRYLRECQVMSSSQILLAFSVKASVVVLDKKE